MNRYRLHYSIRQARRGAMIRFSADEGESWNWISTNDCWHIRSDLYPQRGTPPLPQLHTSRGLCERRARNHRIFPPYDESESKHEYPNREAINHQRTAFWIQRKQQTRKIKTRKGGKKKLRSGKGKEGERNIKRKKIVLPVTPTKD